MTKIAQHLSGSGIFDVHIQRQQGFIVILQIKNAA